MINPTFLMWKNRKTRAFRNIMSGKKLTRHHILPSSKWWTDDDRNIIMLSNKVHRAIHQIFNNDDPIEQIKTLTLTINWQALTDDFKQRIVDILIYKDPSYYLKDGIYRKKNYEYDWWWIQDLDE